VGSIGRTSGSRLGGSPEASRARRRRRWLVAALGLAVAAAAPGVSASVTDEYGLKAAFLYQFTKYVSWPDDADGPVAICVLGDDPFGTRLDETLEGKTAQGHPIRARRIDSARAGSDCRIVFVSRSERARVESTLAAIGDGPTLTVADMPGFPLRGGMINLRVEDDRVKLEVNPENAERAGLKIRSELLRLADVVRN